MFLTLVGEHRFVMGVSRPQSGTAGVKFLNLHRLNGGLRAE